MIKPSIGRIVWVKDRRFLPEWLPTQQKDESDEDFKKELADAEVQQAAMQPMAAIVTFVHEDDCINVAYFHPEGDPKPLRELFLRQDDATVPEDAAYFAEWMPYQKEQAAKAAVPPVPPAPKAP